MGAPGWRWFVAGGVHVPGAARLALEEAARRLPGARLLTVRLPGREAWADTLSKERAIGAAEHRAVLVRAAPAGCLLVREDVLAVHGLPPAAGRFGADLAWSARVLRDGGGYLLPGVVVQGGGRRAPGRGRAAASLLRLLAQPGLTPPERLWLSYALARLVAGGRP